MRVQVDVGTADRTEMTSSVLRVMAPAQNSYKEVFSFHANIIASKAISSRAVVRPLTVNVRHRDVSTHIDDVSNPRLAVETLVWRSK